MKVECDYIRGRGHGMQRRIQEKGKGGAEVLSMRESFGLRPFPVQ